MSHHTAAYPTEEQYEQWKTEADQMDMSISEYVERMVEAGRTKIPITTQVSQSDRELREQRNDLKEELAHARRRIQNLGTSRTTESLELNR